MVNVGDIVGVKVGVPVGVNVGVLVPVDVRVDVGVLVGVVVGANMQTTWFELIVILPSRSEAQKCIRLSVNEKLLNGTASAVWVSTEVEPSDPVIWLASNVLITSIHKSVSPE